MAFFLKTKSEAEDTEEKEEVQTTENAENVMPVENSEGSEELPNEPVKTLDAEMRQEFEAFKAQKFLKKTEYFVSEQKLQSGELKQSVNAAKTYGFGGVAVFPIGIASAVRIMGKADAGNVTGIVSYPYGEDMPKVKLYAAKRALSAGAGGVLCYLSSFWIRQGDYRLLKKDVTKICSKLKKRGRVRFVVDIASISTAEKEKTFRQFKGTEAEVVLKNGGETVALSDITLFTELSGKAKVDVMGDYRADESLKAFEAGADHVITPLAVEAANEYAVRFGVDFSAKKF